MVAREAERALMIVGPCFAGHEDLACRRQASAAQVVSHAAHCKMADFEGSRRLQRNSRVRSLQDSQRKHSPWGRGGEGSEKLKMQVNGNPAKG